MPRGYSPYDEARIQDRLWNPATLGPSVWHDAADLKTVTLVSGEVSQWDDKSGNGNHAVQATSANRPTFESNGLRGLPMLRFNSATNPQFLQTLKFAGPSISWSCFVVMSTDIFAVNNGISWGADGAGFQQSGIYCVNDSGSFAVVFNRSGAAVGVGNAAFRSTSTLLVGAGVYETSGSAFFATCNGNVGATTTGLNWTVGSLSYFGLGLYQATANIGISLKGTIAEFLAFPRAVSTMERQLVEAYLAWKWNVRLEGIHPFVLRPPLIGD